MGNRQIWADVSAKKQTLLDGDPARVMQQRKDGKLSARERVQKLLDQGSFVEMDTLVMAGADGAGVVTGYGTVKERPVYVFSQDYTVHGGAIGQQQAKKILKVMDLARKTGSPLVMLLDSAGIRLDEGAKALSAYAHIGAGLARMSGVCPLIAVVVGPCVGAAAMLTKLCDITVMAQDVGALMAQGPQVLGAAVSKEYTIKAAGGAKIMAKQGAAALVAANEDETFQLVSVLLDLLPGSNLEDAPIVDTDDMNRLLPEWNGADIRVLTAQLADNGTTLELYREYGEGMVTLLCRMGGRTVGVVASDAQKDEGLLTAASARKAARFVRLCDCFNLPVLSLIDSKGVAVTAVDAQGEALSSQAQLLYAYAEATCPKVSVVIGDAIGQSFIAMGGKANADISYAWPGAVISALSPEAAVRVLYKDQINASTGNALEARQALAKQYAIDVAGAMNAAEDGFVDDVIDPAMMRQLIIAAFEMLSSKRDTNFPKKHGNLPL